MVDYIQTRALQAGEALLQPEDAAVEWTVDARIVTESQVSGAMCTRRSNGVRQTLYDNGVRQQ